MKTMTFLMTAAMFAGAAAFAEPAAAADANAPKAAGKIGISPPVADELRGGGAGTAEQLGGHLPEGLGNGLS